MSAAAAVAAAAAAAAVPLSNRVGSKQADWQSNDSFDIDRRQRRDKTTCLVLGCEWQLL
jgi:hypothetical protein